VERSSAEAADRVSADVSRIATAVEDRLGRADNLQAQALEKLGGEIARITERLAERISNAERRSAQAIDDVGEQVARVTERVSQRQERATTELADRIRQSEERTARLLDEARQRIDDRLAETQRRVTEAARPAPRTYDDADEALFGEAPFPGYETPPAERPSPRAPPMASNGFDEDGFDVIPAAPAPAFRPAAARTAPSAFEDVELEPNVGFDVDDELIGPATHLYASVQPPAPAPAAAAPAIGLTQSFASSASPMLEDDENALLNDALGHNAAPTAAPAAAPSFETHLEEPEPIQEAPALTTREVIERARAAARAANDRDSGAKPRGPSGPRSSSDDGVLNSLSFGRSRKPAVGGATGALVVAGLLVAGGISAGGYMMMNGKGDGAAPKRASDALSVVQGQDQAGNPPVSGSSPLAAVALAPTPTAQQAAPGPDLSIAYSAAVAKVSAGAAGGLIDIRRLADGGYAPAQFYLAQLYQDGRSGVKKDAVQSRHWLERAAEGGDRTAMHNLALDLHEGVGGARNAPQAAEWFRRAAELGLLDSQFNLAAIYEHGDGVSANPAEAYKWYLVAGRSGDAEARNGALRVRAGLTPDARAVAERAAAEFQPQAANPGVMPATASTAGSPDFVTAQRALNQLGYYQGPTDGVASQALHMAIAAYQRDQSLPTTGNPDAATLAKLSVYTR
jgi:localization factor PodJL